MFRASESSWETHMKSLTFYVSIFCLLFACSKNSDPSSPGIGKGGGDQGEPLTRCNDVITDEGIASYHAKQSNYRVLAMGANRQCIEVVNENGMERRVERTGHAEAGVLPKLVFEKIITNSGNREITVRAEILSPTASEMRTIARDLGLPENGNQVSKSENREPSYVRFGERGSLYYFTRSQHVRENGKTFLQFQISSDNSEEVILSQKLTEFQRTQEGMELLWYPQKGIFHRQFLAHPTGWSSLNAIEVVKSYVRDHEGGTTRDINSRAISNSISWQLDLAQLHQELPELYSFADSEWNQPIIADNTAQDLLQFLRYLVKINPNHSRAPVLEAFNSMYRYQGSTRIALATALDYVEGRTWTKPQFSRLLELAESLYQGFNTHSWEIAQLIAQRTNFERDQSNFIAATGGNLGARALIRQRGDAISIVEAIYAKLAAGLTQTNSALYFRAFDAFKSSFRAGDNEAEVAADKFILSGKVDENSFPLVFTFMRWIVDTTYNSFSDAVEASGKLRSFSQGTTNLFKEVYSWLSGDVYLNRSDALKKTSIFLAGKDFQNDSFQLLKSYYAWLTGTMYLNRSDALEKAEKAVTQGISADAVRNIKELADWYVNTIYLNRSEALSRAEHLVLEAKATTEELRIMKNAIEWMTNTIYMNRSEAAAKGESYITGQNRISAERLAQLKTHTEWYINTMYLNRSEAFLKTEELVFIKALIPSQCALMRSSAEWLVNSVYLNRSEAVKKTEDYLLLNHLDAKKYRELVREFEKYINQGKTRSDALKMAEEKVLG